MNGEFDHLRIVAKERVCLLAPEGEQSFKAHLLWFKRELFSAKADTMEEIAAPVKRWVCDQALPSQLKAEFPWIEAENEKLAGCYEQGKGWEGECRLSWQETRDLYLEVIKAPALLDVVLPFMTELESRGYDKTLRAGQSVGSLVLSRSRINGLRQDQPRIAFWFVQEGIHIRMKFETEEIVDVPTTDFTPQIEAWLKKLESIEPD